jgi:hypothetical protein
MSNGEHFRNRGLATEGQRHEIQEELLFLRGALDSARSEISQLKDEVTALRELTLFLKVRTPSCYVSNRADTASLM